MGALVDPYAVFVAEAEDVHRHLLILVGTHEGIEQAPLDVAIFVITEDVQVREVRHRIRTAPLGALLEPMDGPTEALPEASSAEIRKAYVVHGSGMPLLDKIPEDGQLGLVVPRSEPSGRVTIRKRLAGFTVPQVVRFFEVLLSLHGLSVGNQVHGLGVQDLGLVILVKVFLLVRRNQHRMGIDSYIYSGINSSRFIHDNYYLII